MSDTVRALAANIVSRKLVGASPYILFIGAGASISSDCSSMLRLVDDVLQSRDSEQFNSWQEEISKAEAIDIRYGELLRNDINKKKVGRFMEVWEILDSDSRYAILRKHLWEGKTPSEGYIDLAHLIKAGYFNIVLSTNLDSLMEKAFAEVGLLSPENFIVLVNGKDSPDEIKDQLENTRVPIKLVKLHGSLESPRSYAFTPEELFNFENTIKPFLTRIVNQSLLIIGHSMQDRDINVLFEQEGKEIHFINPSPPEINSPIYNILKVRGTTTVIDGSDAMFDSFFRQLRTYIESESTGTITNNSTTSIEGFLHSIRFDGELKAPRSRYKNLQTLYVKPTEYNDIVSKLENDHILFIIGEPHMGKTYTALYLLWEYYQKDYETIHIRHDQFIHLLHQHEGDLRELLLELFTPKNQRPRIVHFDDPFGETMERRTDALSNQIDTFLELAKGYEHLRVVVTSRLNIFNEALGSSKSFIEDIEELEKTLRVHTSYSSDVLLDILHRYMSFFKPVWASDKKIVAEIDEKLPAMLPAPHNIEFFVRTSEALNSLDAVLAHVEESKKMINALASWMKHMSPYEQIFLMWVEICSTASILFPGAPASEMDIEKAYKENLAYLFSEGYLPGIPTMPFSSARDKFETILLERREDVNSPLQLDFVHPSYHEAFWYAISQKFPITQWWELLCENVRHILRDLQKKIDLVQLKMIERYGTINRDLDQLLLLSAESENTNEQLIALEHMLKRPDQFTPLAQFYQGMNSVISKGDESVKVGFLDLYDKYFYQLPLSMLDTLPAFLFDEYREVRKRAKAIMSTRSGELPEPVHQNKFLRCWEIVSKLNGEHLLTEDIVEMLLDKDDSYLYIHVEDSFVNLTPSEIEQLIKISIEPISNSIIKLVNEIWNKLSDQQKEVILHSQVFESLVFKLSESTDSKINKMENGDLKVTITELVLKGYDQLPLKFKDVYLEKLYPSNNTTLLLDYIKDKDLLFLDLSENVLIKLLNVPGYIQYEILTELLIRFTKLSKEAQNETMDLISNSSDQWVGGSIGQVTADKFNKSLNKIIEDFPFRFIGDPRKQTSGAMLAEMAQCYFDKDIRLNIKFEPLLQALIKDSEVMQYAEDWMDHSCKVFKFFDEEYWSDIKSQMRSLSEANKSAL